MPLKVNIVGGGPAGLYFALLMKGRNAAHDITIYERNARNNTFGWGVVFSDRTFSYLQESDGSTSVAIADRFKRWNNVDVVHRGQKISIHGNKFSGIARIDLLNILQRRCEETGVKLHFETDAPDPASLAHSDLLVGADGVGSGVRQAYGEFFRPSFDPRSNRYIWYGTPQLFHGLTLMFRPDEAGLFMAHAYKFSDSMSTFVVECDPESWENASLNTCPDDEARSYLEKVFRDDLGGQPLLSNSSKWNRFSVVKNERWHHRNVVLLGDALHTVHFSIGSGTKLAFEDAIALAKSFDEHGDDVPAALQGFELSRRPVVEGYQEASLESLLWFENAGAQMHLDPHALAMSVMTRSGRIDLEKVRGRDSDFVAAYERSRPRT